MVRLDYGKVEKLFISSGLRFCDVSNVGMIGDREAYRIIKFMTLFQLFYNHS